MLQIFVVLVILLFLRGKNLLLVYSVHAYVCMHLWSWHNLVGIVTAAGWMIWPSNHGRDKIFLSPECPAQFWCPCVLLNGYQSSFLVVMWPGHEVDCSSPSSAKPTNEWS